ncbi:MAG: peptidylprolyl isomerase [Anaerolineae bacterium]|nr:peptidylprolyl isomerase [Anaerolineae bacterium]
MRTRLSVFCDKVIEAGWLAALVIIPLFFNIYSQRVFEPDKLSLLRSIALAMGVAWIIRLVEDWRSAAPPLPTARQGTASDDTESLPASTLARPSVWQRVVKTPLILPTLLLILVYLVSTALSVVPQVSLLGSYQRLQGTYTTLSYIIVFFLMLQGLRTKQQLNRAITVAILVSFPIALYGLVQHFGMDPLPWGGNVTARVASNMGNAIFVAAFLIMVVPLTLARLMENWKEAAGELNARDGLVGVVAFVLLAGALLVGMLLRPDSNATWLRVAALVAGLGLQVPIYLFTPAERRSRVLAIALPLSFAFLVGFSWVLELLFPPATPQYFWLGLLAMVIFVTAMAAFAYYLRKPVARLLLVAAYFSILITQIICIFYTQSRGPQIGLVAGTVFFLALLGLVRRQVWLSWSAGTLAALAIVFLVVFNTVQSPFLDKLRETRYIGRLGKLLQTESGTGKVRILIWEGVVNMIDWHDPLEYPGDPPTPDRFNALRPIIGYGPESMYVAYNRFYPPDLAHYEKRNASPDRSHNETFDALATTGGVGFAVYMFLFTSVFYYGLKWLGLIQKRWQALAFLGLWIGSGVLGSIVAWAWGGPVYVGVGIPIGVMAGLAVYVLVFLVEATVRFETRQRIGGRYALWMLALLSAIVAHFAEIHFGIAIASTRTYFWAFAALMVVIGTRLAMQPVDTVVEITPGNASRPTVAGAEPKTTSRRRKRRGEQAAPLPAKVSERGNRDWLGWVLFLSIVAILILGTMLFDFVTIQEGNPGPIATIWRSLVTKGGDPAPPVMLALFAATWMTIGMIGLSDLASREELVGRKQGMQSTVLDWLEAVGIYAGVSIGGAALFGLLHTINLKPATGVTATNPVSNTITFYYIAIFVIITALAAVLTFAFRRSAHSQAAAARPPSQKGGNAVGASRVGRRSAQQGRIGVAAVAVVLVLIVGILIYASNLSIIRADILYKQGLSYENAKIWTTAIGFYEKAIDIAKDQDFYYLFLGRANMEQGKAATGQERNSYLTKSEQALLEARHIAPLNTDHSANLARLFRTWGSLSSGQDRLDRLNKALANYEAATALSPHNAQLFDEWGQTYAVLGEYDKAMEKYQQALALDSKYNQTYLLIGELAMQQKKWDEAKATYEQLIALSPKSADAYGALGYVNTQMGDLESSLQAYQKAVELSPKNFNHRKNLSIIYQQLGKLDEAIQEATEALALATTDDQKQTMQNFIAQLRQQQAAPTAEEAQQAQELLITGSTQMNAGQWISAEASFSQVLTLDPYNAQAHSALAYVYAKQGRTDEAIAENLTVIELAPTDYNSHKNLAILYQQKGDLAAALSEAEQALELAPTTEITTLQTYVDQLKKAVGEAPPAEKAGDLTPEERNDMYTASPSMTIDTNKSYQATIITAKGNIVISLATKDAPQTVNNFAYLSRQGFYDGLTFHRVEHQSGFELIQGGDPLGQGNGGPGYTIPAEIGLPHDQGAIAMARLSDQVNPEKASSGSQFYICLVPIHQLDGGYTVFGYVTEGLDIAKQIAVGDKILAILITEK